MVAEAIYFIIQQTYWSIWRHTSLAEDAVCRKLAWCNASDTALHDLMGIMKVTSITYGLLYSVDNCHNVIAVFQLVYSTVAIMFSSWNAKETPNKAKEILVYSYGLWPLLQTREIGASTRISCILDWKNHSKPKFLLWYDKSVFHATLSKKRS